MPTPAACAFSVGSGLRLGAQRQSRPPGAAGQRKALLCRLGEAKELRLFNLISTSNLAETARRQESEACA